MAKKQILITGASVADGTGAEPKPGDILIEDDRIVEYADRIDAPEAETFNAKGLIAAPGFIDMHTHGDFDRLKHAVSIERLLQGCTMEVVANCGLCSFPFNDTIVREFQPMMGTIVKTDFDGFTRLSDYFSFIENRGVALNLVSHVGHGVVRGNVMGMSTDPADDGQFSKMAELLSQALDDGALGMSTGLIYPTGSMTKTDELVRLMKSASAHRPDPAPLYASHIRDESDGVLDALDEAIEIAEQSGTGLQIAHIKCMGEKNWGRAGEVIEKIDSARNRGADITADIYPYLYASTLLAMILLQPIGAPDTVLVASSFKSNGDLWDEVVGRSLQDLSDMWNISPEDAGRRVITEAPSSMGVAKFMSEDDMLAFLGQPWTVIGSDGIEDREGKPHPRIGGTMPRVLGRYVREKGVLTWGAAVAKMTGNTAKKLGLTDRGLIRPGCFADITLFDPETVIDTATYKEPHNKPVGILHVMINGVWALKDGDITGELPGRIIRY
ncbi:MAG: D-aminoacylase [Deltaproteobacteria bacterium]|nr:D-aminoacylase [Candidatus Zymogenaceae bacterium]